MFGIYRGCFYKTVPRALDAAEMNFQMFCATEPPDPETYEWAGRLYDLAHALFELHENVAGRSLELHEPLERQHFLRALEMLEETLSILPDHFAPLAPRHRLVAGMDGLITLLHAASGKEYAHEEIQLAHGDVAWLRNTAHNAYLDWRRQRPGSTCPSNNSVSAPERVTSPWPARVVRLFRSTPDFEPEPS